MSHSTTRRVFLGAASAAAASRVWGANDRINVAIIGLGGRGTNHLNIYSKMPEARVAGLCDVNQTAREKSQATLAKNGGDKAKEFVDMREAFADPSIEAVSIATPNHWHALATIWAVHAGKDVYCEKPACYNIHEGQAMIAAQEQTKRIVQIGSQHRSMPFKIKAMQSLRDGVIGEVYLAKGLCFKPRPTLPHTEDSPTPPGVNWDLFLGPAPMRPFNELRFAYNWHWFWDTGNGDIGNQGVHEMGVCRWALGDPQWPKAAVAMGGKYGPPDQRETPNTLLASYDFGGREIIFEVRGNDTNAEGSAPPAPRPTADKPAPKRPDTPINVTVGNIFYGFDGYMVMNDTGYQIYKGTSSELVAEEKPQRGEDSTRQHMENFLAACHSRKQTDLHDPLANAVLSAGLCHLANISYRSGHKLNVEAGPKFTGDPTATAMITRPVYRKPYVV
ncbi:MAG TPA: Gfo/Idh/MocA family oxidoreductase [Bryobacteraceae bacterium]|nr:Gfo/Idh/MocA family oxidoreductase [Bryobacteraceae bacterium]